jgi:ribokinase
VEYVAATASANENMVILNPAPACQLPESLFPHISVITPNQNEAELLSGIKVTDVTSAKLAAAAIRDKGVKNVIVTLGQDGAVVLSEGEYTHVPAHKVEAVDTTAAGDVFNGALAVALSENKNLVQATVFACKASLFL